MRTIAGLAVLLLALAACSKKDQTSAGGATAPKEPTKAAEPPSVKLAPKAAETPEAKPAATAEVAESTPDPPAPKKEPDPFDRFTLLMGDEVAGFSAQTKVEIASRGGALTIFRIYFNANRERLKVVVMDTRNAQSVRANFKELRKTKLKTLKSIRLARQPAYLSWDEDVASADLKILLADRYLVEIRIRGADKAKAVALTVAKALDIKKFAAAAKQGGEGAKKK